MGGIHKPLQLRVGRIPSQSPQASLAQPEVSWLDDGLPSGVVGFTKERNESIKAYGNAIVPQVALRIFEAIQEYEKRT